MAGTGKEIVESEGGALAVSALNRVVTISDVPADADPDIIKPEVEYIDALQTPMNKLYPGLESLDPQRQARAVTESAQYSGPILDGLKQIGVVVIGRLPDEEAKVWALAMLQRISDLPPGVLVRAVSDARHAETTRWTVDKTIRECAKQYETKLHLAKLRLEALGREIKAAKKAALAPPPKPKATREDWEEFNSTMLAAGLPTRFFFDEPALDEQGNEIPDAIGNLRRLKEGETDPAARPKDQND